MMNHEKVYKVAKKDRAFIAAVELTGETIPVGLFADTMEKGMWVAMYSGWILGMFGTAESLRRSAEWRLL